MWCVTGRGIVERQYALATEVERPNPWVCVGLLFVYVRSRIRAIVSNCADGCVGGFGTDEEALELVRKILVGMGRVHLR